MCVPASTVLALVSGYGIQRIWQVPSPNVYRRRGYGCSGCHSQQCLQRSHVWCARLPLCFPCLQALAHSCILLTQ
jgi:hypothetical protein